MTRFLRWIGCWGWMGLAGLSAQAAPESAPLPPAFGLIVQLKDAAAHDRAQALAAHAPDAARLQRVLRAMPAAVTRTRPVGRAAQHLDFGRVLSGAEAGRLAEQLRADPEVEWVVPNEREHRLQVVPNDPYFPKTGSQPGQWWLHPVGGSSSNAIEDRLRGVAGIQTAWSTQTGSAAAVVAVLDSGLASHSELAGHALPGYDFVSEVVYANDGGGRDADPSDPGDWVDAGDLSNPLFKDCVEQYSSWHGTEIAGIVTAASNNAAGVAGINWNGGLLPVRVAGKCGATVADIVDGMRWAAGLAVAGAPANPNPARILNISFGSASACNAAYQSAIDEIKASRGAVVVAAAGNENGMISRPANCSGVVGVVALNRDGFKASYSNFGPQAVIATVGGDPGVFGAWGPWLGDDGIVTTSNAGFFAPGQEEYRAVAGTSFSAPIVAGVASLMLSVNPSLSAAQIIQGLRASARRHVTSTRMPACSNMTPGRCICTTATCGAGVLDAVQALAYAQNPGGYTAPNWPAVDIDSTQLSLALSQGQDMPPNPGAGGGQHEGGGGGALGWVWLLGLAMGVCALGRTSRPCRAGTERLAQQRLGAQA